MPAPIPCPRCSLPLWTRAFPATLRQLAAGSSGEVLTSEELSSCFFHPTKKAEVSCGQCGRFLCALCDLEVEGKHLCPTCLEAGMKKQSLATFKTAVTRWDNIALMLATVPLVVVLGIYFTIFTAPAALFIALWKWNSPRERLVGRGRGRLIFAMVLAVIQVASWVVLLVMLLNTRFS